MMDEPNKGGDGEEVQVSPVPLQRQRWCLLPGAGIRMEAGGVARGGARPWVAAVLLAAAADCSRRWRSPADCCH